MYRRGIIDAVDPKTHRARVKFPERQGLVSGWLEVLTRATHIDKSVWMPRVGDQVAVLLDEREEGGCVLGALYSSADPVPAGVAEKVMVQFGEGFVLEYDRASKTLRVTPPEGGSIELAGSDSAVALATKVRAELDAIKDELSSHTHEAGASLLAPPGTSGGPCTGVTGAPAAIGYSPGDVGAAKVHSS